MKQIDNKYVIGQLSDYIKRLESGVSVNCDDRSPQGDELGVLKTSAVSSQYFRHKEAKLVTDPSQKAKLKTKVKRDRIIICRKNTPELVGSSAYVERGHPNLYLPDLLWQAEPIKGKTHMRWLAYMLQQPEIRHRIKTLSSGTSPSMANISKADFLWIPIPTVSIDQQMEVTRNVEIWDHAIDLTEQLITAKQERRTWLMQQLLTGKRRLPGFEGDWRTVHLGDVFTNRVESGREDLSLIAITGENGVVNRDEVGRKDTSSKDKSRYLRISPGDIGYNTMRMWQGVCGLSTMEGIVSPAYTIVTPKSLVDGEFMALFFKSPAMIHLFHRHSQGLVDDTLNLKWKHFAQIKVTIPDKGEQGAIAGVFRSFDRELDLLRKQLDALREQKKGLMQQLLTGKVRGKA